MATGASDKKHLKETMVVRSLNEHLQTHQGFQCKHCNKIFVTQSLLEVHEFTFHYSLLCKYTCKICGEKYMKLHMLQKHMGKHAEKGETVPKEIGVDTQLQKHQAAFQCKQCDKSFFSQALLEFHKSDKHKSDKDMCCNICGKMYNIARCLEKHLEKHKKKRRRKKCVLTELKDMAEELKGETVLKDNCVDTHVQKHQDTFHCQLCDKSFFSLALLEFHKFDKHECCNICGKMYKIKGYLEKHKKKHDKKRRLQKIVLTEPKLIIYEKEMKKEPSSLMIDQTEMKKESELLIDKPEIKKEAELMIDHTEMKKEPEMMLDGMMKLPSIFTNMPSSSMDSSENVPQTSDFENEEILGF